MAPMVAREAFATQDPEEAVPIMGRFFPQLRMSSPHGDFSLELSSAVADGVTLLDYRLASPRSSSSISPDDEIVVGQLRAGGLSLRTGREVEIATAAPWVFPRGLTVGRWDDVTMRTLSFAPAQVERLARAVSGDDTHRFAFLVTAAVPARVASWLALVDVVADELRRGDPLSASSIARATRITHLMLALLATFPNTVSAGDRTPVGTAILSAALRRALTFMEENAQLPITIVDVAAASRLSVRGLQYAFRDRLQTTPTAQLRAIRLARTHDDLIAADPTDGATVAVIAQAWGFGHLGRFAHEYRKAYGEPPRHTLRAG